MLFLGLETELLSKCPILSIFTVENTPPVGLLLERTSDFASA
jgi:hypothetical protein